MHFKKILVAATAAMALVVAFKSRGHSYLRLSVDKTIVYGVKDKKKMSTTVVVIPKGVTRIAGDGFNDCTSLVSVEFADPSGWYDTELSNFTGGKAIDVSDPEENAKQMQEGGKLHGKWLYKKAK